MLFLYLFAPFHPYSSQEADELRANLSLGLSLPLINAIYLQFLQFLISLGEEASDQVLYFFINISLISEQNQSLTDSLISKAPKEVLI